MLAAQHGHTARNVQWVAQQRISRLMMCSADSIRLEKAISDTHAGDRPHGEILHQYQVRGYVMRGSLAGELHGELSRDMRGRQHGRTSHRHRQPLRGSGCCRHGWKPSTSWCRLSRRRRARPKVPFPVASSRYWRGAARRSVAR